MHLARALPARLPQGSKATLGSFLQPFSSGKSSSSNSPVTRRAASCRGPDADVAGAVPAVLRGRAGSLVFVTGHQAERARREREGDLALVPRLAGGGVEKLDPVPGQRAAHGPGRDRLPRWVAHLRGG